jgi:hydrophobic/amphiphilic exporter-1 (mainly G- bacteria), HAE1 family
MVQQFITRPVLSIVVSIFIVILGVIAMKQLPITQFPDIVPPAVTVTTKYTGANAEVCAKAVVTPLERAINGVAGMTYMTSVSGNDGTSIIQVYFQVGTDPDVAAVNVQTRVQTVLDELPEEVIKAGVITEKEVNSMLLYVNLLSEDTDIDEKFIFNFADINVLPELKRIDGVGFADIMGQREYAMRIWLHPDRLFAYKLSAEDVIQALRNQNVEAAPGKIGESSGKHPQALQYVMRYTGKFTQVAQYENLVIKATETGQILRLKDLADVEFGSLDYDVLSKENGRPSAAILLKQRPGSNAAEVIENVKKRLAELKTTTFPPGMGFTISYDVSRFLDASIQEVIKTLLEAFLLVALVVFIFLQDWRATLVPIIAVPVSLVGTFTFMLAFGFSINLLTLFSLVLAIGIVVDNAIVVVEAVHAKMEEKDMPVLAATQEAMHEISGAILAITLVMGAVFVPVAFLSGPIGVFFRQFSVTMAISIALSGLTALTLTPALCVLLLKKPEHNQKNLLGKFFHAFNHRYDQIAQKYLVWVGVLISKRILMWLILLGSVVGTAVLSGIVPSGFIPSEDQGTLYVNATTPAGATLERTESVMDQVYKSIKGVDAIESFSTLAGFSLLTDGSGASYGTGIITLKPWEERKETVDELTEIIRSKTNGIKDASIQFFPPPAVPGFGNASGFEFRIQDRSGSGDLQKLASVSNEFAKKLNEAPEIQNTFSSFDPSFPQYMLEVDQEAAAQKGVNVLPAMDNLQTLLGSFYATNFIRFGQMYKVMVQVDPRYRAHPDDVLKFYAKNKDGEMVPYSSFVKMKRVYGPEQFTRYNMFTSAMVNGEPAPGFSSGVVLEIIRAQALKSLPRGYTLEWSGMTREEDLAGNQAIFIFAICLLFVYLLLAAQYESFLLPFPVLLFLPMGAMGTYAFLYLFGLQNNIYAQVALVMLIGLLGKNAILIVEFAIAKQKDGASIIEAAKEGAFSRLRPILMTSFAFVAGLIPLMIASGAGAIGNRTIGTASAGGMILGTVGGLLVIPGLYVVFASLSAKWSKNEK